MGLGQARRARPPFQVLKAFIDQHRAPFGGEPICKVLRIAPSGYRRHAAQFRDPSKRCARAKRDEVLQPESKRVWQVNRPVCGVPKVWKQMSREGIAVARCTVGRLMKLQGLRGAVRRKHVRTTIADRPARFPVWFKRAQPTPFLAVIDTQTFTHRYALHEEAFGSVCIACRDSVACRHRRRPARTAIWTTGPTRCPRSRRRSTMR
ncbi:IS3 family transposase [Burkholderia pseudomallei]|nr:IS3 family transposase [Burkholderia pseudomallei]MBF3440372.1 IS3 family transposase [Burkholderia pseudomallei]MBF3523845.1 IS3 family transposase [Burkholderia pseudomallei]MBF3547576.1 IS3 family transposase [Burkholderia pseudomallei]MBF3607598.1 IS3 family transposase [Burkholderia pseudomallei]